MEVALTLPILDLLESRTFLSSVMPGGGDDVPVQDVAALRTPARAAASVKKGWYQGTATLEGMQGKLYLQVLSVSGGTFTGNLKSADWGAFTVTVNGKVTNAVVTLTGKNATTHIKSLKGTLSGKTLAGSLTLTQMGLSAIKGTFTCLYTSTAPRIANVKEPSVVGEYQVVSSDGFEAVMSIERQEDGKFWGRMDRKLPITGVILNNGLFGARVKEDNGSVSLRGQWDPATGVLTGEWEKQRQDGTFKRGTFTATRQ
jgi:hypothetical protein